MRHLRVPIILFFLSFLIVACGPDEVDEFVTPSFESMLINGESPLDDTGEPRMHMAEKNELLTIEVFLDNPSNAEINSLKINGTTYRQTRFEEESTNSHIIFNFDVLRVPGAMTYVLEEIEYAHEGVDVIEITDGNLFEAYILESVPSATFTNVTPHKDAMDVTLNVSDQDQTLNEAHLQLLEGEEVVDSLVLSVGVLTHTFESLLSDTAYTLRIVASFERGDGALVSEDYVLVEQSDVQTLAKTEPSLQIDAIEPAKSGASFALSFADDDDTGAVSAILIYRDETLVKSLDDISERAFEGLLSDTEYMLEVHFTYDLEDGEGPQDLMARSAFTTLAKVVPTITYESVTTDHDRLSFDIVLNDSDSVLIGDSLLVELIHEGEIFKSKTVSYADLSDIGFDGLFNNNTYTIVTRASYNLNDGTGEHSDMLIASADYDTPSLELPELSITQTEGAQSYIVWNIDATMFEGIVTPGTMRLSIYDEASGTLLKTAELINDRVTFEIRDLLAGQSVRVEVEATYNLDDGEGDKTDIIHTSYFTTTLNSVPSGSVDTVRLHQDRVDFTVTINDPNSTILPGTLVAFLYEDDGEILTLIETMVIGPELSAHSFDYAPRYENTYTVTLYTDYDLRDGAGVVDDHHLDSVYEIATLSPKAPTAELSGLEADTAQVGFEYTILDIDGTIIEDGIRLHLDGETIILDALTGTVTIGGLHSNSTYTLILEVDYLTSDDRVRTLEIARTFETDTNVTPDIEFGTTTPDQTTIGFTFELTDPDDTGQITEITLYRDETLVESLTDLALRSFTGLLSGVDYEIRATFTYDLNDGTGPKTIHISTTTTTEIKDAPAISFDEVTSDARTIDFTLPITDPDDTGQITEIALYRGGTRIETLSDLDVRRFEDLWSDTTHTIRVTYTFDLNDGTGTEDIVIETDIATTALSVPDFFFTGSNSDKTSISFTLSITDADSTGEITAIALYLDGALVESHADLSLRHFEDLHSSTTYTIEATYTYDLNDGAGERTLIVNTTETTDPLAMATVITDNIQRTLGGVGFDVTVEDPDTTFIDQEFTIDLIDSTGQIVRTRVETSGGTFTFDELSSAEDYTIRITADIDMNDGSTSTSVLFSQETFTTIDARPEISMDPFDVGKRAFKFELTYHDTHGVLEGYAKVAVYDEDGILISDPWRLLEETTEGQLSDLYSGYNYTIKVYGDVDYADGSGLREDELLYEDVITTVALARPVPQITLGDIGIDQQISLSLGAFEDTDEVYSSMSLVLYEIVEDGDDIELETIMLDLENVEGDYTFSHTYEEEKTYRIELRGDYDLNHPDYVHTDALLAHKTFITVRHND